MRILPLSLPFTTLLFKTLLFKTLPLCSALLAGLAGCIPPPTSFCPEQAASPFQDPWEVRTRLATDTFIEPLEVQTTPDGLVLFCSGVQGLNVVNAQVPNAPVRVAGPLGGSLGDRRFPRCQHIALDPSIDPQSLAFVSNRGDEIQPDAYIAGFAYRAVGTPEQITHNLGQRTVEGLALGDGFLYAAMHNEGVAVFSVGASTLTEVGTIEGLNNAWSATVDNGLLYVVDAGFGLVIYDLEDGANPAELGRVPLSGAPQYVTVDAALSVAYVAAGAGGLHAVDVSTPSAPGWLGTLDTPGSALQVALAQTDLTRPAPFAYVADWNQALVVDLADPADMRIFSAERVEVSDGFPRVLGIGGAGNFSFIGEWTGLFVAELFPARSAPDLRVRQLLLEMPKADVAEVVSAALIVENIGSEPLSISDVVLRNRTASGDFEVGPTSLTLAPGEADVLEVLFTATDDRTAQARVYLCSDDPDRPATRVDLVGNPERNGRGDLVDDFQMQLTTGGTWRLSEELGSPMLLAYFATF